MKMIQTTFFKDVMWKYYDVDGLVWWWDRGMYLVCDNGYLLWPMSIWSYMNTDNSTPRGIFQRSWWASGGRLNALFECWRRDIGYSTQWLLQAGSLKYSAKKEWLLREFDQTLALIQGSVDAEEVDKHKSGKLLQRGSTTQELMPEVGDNVWLANP